MFAEGAKALLFLSWNGVLQRLTNLAVGKNILVFVFLFLFLFSPLFAYADFVTTSPLQDTSRWGSCTPEVIQRIDREPSIRFYNPFSSNPEGTADYRCSKSNGDQVWYRACGGAANQCSVQISSDGFRTFTSGGLIQSGREYQYDTVTGRMVTGNTAFVISEACTGDFRPNGDEIIRTCRTSGNPPQTWTEHCDQDNENQCYITQGAGGVDTIRSAPYDRSDATATYTIENSGGRVARAYVTQGGQVLEGTQTNGIEEAAGALGGWLKDVTIGLVSAIIWFVAQIILWIFLGLLALVSWLFDGIVYEFVIEMGKYTTSPDAVAIKTAWVMIRDLANIGIIAGLVATAIGTIVGTGNYSISKTLARLILAALLVNFSYFFAGAIIDFSNFTAKAAYENLIVRDCEQTTGACGPAAQLLLTLNLSQFGVTVGNAVTNETGDVQRSINSSGAQTSIAQQGAERSNEGISLSRQATFAVLQLIFVVALMFVMLSAISLLIARFVALIFILVTSPIGIAGSAVPLLKSYSDEWWKELWNQTMFAPVYFVLLGISLDIIKSFAGPIKGGVWAQEAAGGNMSSTIGLIALFTLAIGFTWTALSTAKKMSAAGGRFKELYDGVQKYLTKPIAGYATREVLGRGALAAAGRLAGFSTRVGEWAKNSRALGAAKKYIPGAKSLLKGIGALGTATDRAAQSQLDKLAGQKFYGFKSAKDLRAEKIARRGALEAKKDTLQEEDKKTGKGAERELKEKERAIKDRNKKRDASDKEIARLEQLERDGKLDATGKKRLEELRSKRDADKEGREEDQKKLADIQAFKDGRKKRTNDGITKDSHTGELKEGERLEALHKERTALEAKSDPTAEEKKRLAEVNAEIADEENFERLKQEFGIGGADGALRRAESKYRRAYEAGELLESIDEEERSTKLESKNGGLINDPVGLARMQTLEEERAKDPTAFENDPAKKKELEDLQAKAYRTENEEKEYAAGLRKDTSALTPAEKTAHEARMAELEKKLGVNEKEERDLYRDKKKVLTPDDRNTLKDLEAKKLAGNLVDAEEIKKYDNLKERERNNGKLNKNAKENIHHYATRQNLRKDGLGRKTNFKDEEGNFVDREGDGAYDYRLEVDDANIGLRKMRGDRQNIVGNIPKDHLLEEYRKGRDITSYATALTDDEFLELMKNHELDEGTRHEMWRQKMGGWGSGVVAIQKDLESGKLKKGTAEYKERMLKLYNQVTRHIRNDVFVEALKQSAHIGEMEDGTEVRLKDLNTKEGKRDFRSLTWNTSSSTAFADAKDKRAYGTDQTAEIARSKRSSVDEIRDIEAAMNMLSGLKDEDRFLTNIEGTVMYDAKARAIKATGNLLRSSQEVITQYENPETRGGLTQDDYIAALRNRKVAQLHQESIRTGTSPLDSVISHVSTFDQPGGKNMEGETRQEIKIRVASKIAGKPLTVTDMAEVDEIISEKDLDTFIKVDTTHRHRNGKLIDKSTGTAVEITADQQIIYDQSEASVNASVGWFDGKNAREVSAVLNKRNMHSTSTYKGIQSGQIPKILENQDGAEVTRFWEGMLATRDKKEVLQIIRNPVSGEKFVRPSKETLTNINAVRIGNGLDPIREDDL